MVVSHGLGARDDSVWFPAFEAELEGRGHRVVIPNLPGTDAPRLDPWRETLTAAAAGPARDIVLVGHSIGAVNVLRMLEAHDPGTGVFAGVVLVSASVHEVGYDLLAEFFKDDFDWSHIRRTAGQFRVLQAIDDPVNAPDPLEHVNVLVRELGATALILPTGGHLGAAPDDHIQLPEAVRLVVDCLDAGR
ncbi:RBBP9/YdeN family alpha/beta hydrolase [Nocardia sp. NPDC059228]|uniref:RBBP9/YdeN family alpha/beta hydrolase n=1 Tax=Nocardia sp. NPDC059228 TaxID=3346777 RepID=UPI0036960C25